MMSSRDRLAIVLSGLLFVLGPAAMPVRAQALPRKPAPLPGTEAASPGPGGWREAFALRGFKGHPEHLSFSADGKSLFAIWSNGALKQWDAATGKELATLKPDASDSKRDKQTVSTYPPHVLSADGKLLARGRADGTVKVWEVSTGKLKGTLHGPAEPVISAAFSPDGQSLAASSLDNTIRLWDLDKMTQKAVYEECGASSLLFAPDGKTLLANRDEFHVLSAAELKKHRDNTRKGVPNVKPGALFEMTVTAGPHYTYTRKALDDLLLLDADSLKASKPALKMNHAFYLTLWPTDKGPVLAVRDLKATTALDPETLKPVEAKLPANALMALQGVSGDGSLMAEGSTFREGGSFMLCLPPGFDRFPNRMPRAGTPSKSKGQVSIYETAMRKLLARVEKGNEASSAALSPDGKMLAASIQFQVAANAKANANEYRIQLWRDRSESSR